MASRTLEDLSWSGSKLLKGDVATEVAELKRQPGRELQVNGSGELAQTLIEHDLIDEYRLITVPVVLGRGKRLVAEGTKPVALNAIDRRSTDAGVSIDAYVPAGEPTFGAIGPEIEAQAASWRDEGPRS